jgi:hypothetical protein
VCNKFLIAALLLIGTVGCGQSSTPSSTSPSSSCTFALSTGATINGNSTGGSFNETVTTTPATGCSWTATSPTSWIHVPASASGTGTGTFTFTVDANAGADRSGTLSVAGQTVTFNQSSPSATTPTPAPACTITLSIGTTIDGYPNGGSFPIGVTTAPSSGCTWTATSQATWIHIADGTGGNGSGAFTFTADANPGPNRSGTLTVGGHIVVFNQTSTSGTTQACAYSLSIGSTIAGYPSGGTFPVGVKTTSGCGWTAASNASWIHVTSGASGSGDGAFTFVADANPGPARSGTLTAAGQIVVFNQSSATP